MRKVFIILFFLITAKLFSQFVNPHDEYNSRTTENFSPYTPIKEKQTEAKNKKQKSKKHSKKEKVNYVNKKTAVRVQYFKKMRFTFDGKITFPGEKLPRRPLDGYIAHYDIKDRLVCVEYYGRRSFEIYIKYEKTNKKQEMIWVHNNYYFMKFTFNESIRFFIKINVFKFILKNSSLDIPEFKTKQKKYFLKMETDNFSRINFISEIKKQDLSTTKNYYVLLLNEKGNWHTAKYFELEKTRYLLKKMYTAVYHKNKKYINIREYHIDNHNDDIPVLHRSYFYDYKNSCLVKWDLYIPEDDSYWEILYENWEFECFSGEIIVKNRENVFTDNYLQSVFVALHIKSWFRPVCRRIRYVWRYNEFIYSNNQKLIHNR